MFWQSYKAITHQWASLFRKYNYQETMFGVSLEGVEGRGVKPLLNYFYVGVALSLSNPIDFIRFRMQTMQELIYQGRLTRPYRNVVDCCRRVVVEEGKNAFWKGNCSNLLKFYPAQALNWINKELFHSLLHKLSPPSPNDLNSHFLLNYLGGAAAGLTTRALLYPLEFTRNKMNNRIERAQGGIISCLTQAYAKEGLRGIYRGALISFIGVAIFRSTYFGIYDTFKEQTNSAIERWLVSYLSVFCAIGLTYPSDTVRRRMMLTSCQSYKYKGFMDCCGKIWEKEGVAGFYRGAPMILLQSATGATIYFMFDKIIKDLKSIESN